MRNFKQLIGNNLVKGEGIQLEVHNPATGQIIASIPTATESQAIKAAEAARESFGSWSSLSLLERERYILNFKKTLIEHKDQIVQILIAETGKPQGNAEYDFDMLTDCLSFFIEEAKRLEGSLLPDYTGKHVSLTIHKPLGVVVGYLAWNFPLLNLGYKLGPILASGCTCVLKPSSQTPLASLYVGELARDSGMPAGVINLIVGAGETICSALNKSEIPQMLTLIGSSETGRKIVEQSATSIKHFSLELGGNAPAVVLKDADIANAAFQVADIKFGNAGQVCVAANRVFVHEKVKEAFVQGILSYVERIALGDSEEENTILMGPMVSEKAQSRMQDLVDDALAKGAKLLFGGKKAEMPGYYFQPTVLENVHSDMKVYKEEIFGPILPIISFTDSDNIIQMANDTEFGLAAYLFTENLKNAMNISARIDAGSVCVNEPFYSYNLPHGGCKNSGIGKDCSRYSLEEYYFIQRISVLL